MENIKPDQSEAFRAYLPAIVTDFFTIITFILYSTVIPTRFWSVYFSLSFMMFVPFVIVLLNRRLSLGLPQYLIILMCSHAVVSVDLGTAMGWYSKIPWWDAAVHCYFGFLACATLYYLFFRLKNCAPETLDYIVIVLLVISFAAIWEVYEFVTGAIIDSDMQDVLSLLAKGLNPITDTMSDIVVATVGALLFEVGLFLKNKLARRKNQGVRR